MSDNENGQTPNAQTPHEKTPAEKLAELVAKRKAAAGAGPSQGPPGQRRSERDAAARSASKSKPALRK